MRKHGQISLSLNKTIYRTETDQCNEYNLSGEICMCMPLLALDVKISQLFENNKRTVKLHGSYKITITTENKVKAV